MYKKIPILLALIFVNPAQSETLCLVDGTDYAPQQACNEYQLLNHPNTSDFSYSYLNHSVVTVPGSYSEVMCEFSTTNHLDPYAPSGNLNFTLYGCTESVIEPSCVVGQTEAKIFDYGSDSAVNIDGCFGGCYASLTTSNEVWEDTEGNIWNDGIFTYNGSTCESESTTVESVPSGSVVYVPDSGSGGGTGTTLTTAPDPTIGNTGLAGLGEFTGLYPTGKCKDQNGNIHSTPEAACQVTVDSINAQRASIGARNTSLNWVSYSATKQESFGPFDARCDTGAEEQVAYTGTDGSTQYLDHGQYNFVLNCSTNGCFETDGICDGNTGGGTDTGSDGTASGGLTCSSAPVCSGDEIGCATLHQQWLTRCEAKDSRQTATSSDFINADVDAIDTQMFGQLGEFAESHPFGDQISVGEIFGSTGGVCSWGFSVNVMGLDIDDDGALCKFVEIIKIALTFLFVGLTMATLIDIFYSTVPE